MRKAKIVVMMMINGIKLRKYYLLMTYYWSEDEKIYTPGIVFVNINYLISTYNDFFLSVTETFIKRRR